MDYELSGVPMDETLDDAYSTTVDTEAAAVLDDVDRITEAYHDWQDGMTAYPAAEQTVDHLDPAPEAIHRFCMEAPLEQDDGYFVSALINTATADRYTLPDMTGVDHVGYRTMDRVRVEGGVGDSPADTMHGGFLHVEGDAGNSVGRAMLRGAVRIDGDAKDWLGQEMRGGIVTVRGETGAYVGKDMEDGVINIHEDADLSRWQQDGRIYTIEPGEQQAVYDGAEEGWWERKRWAVREELEQERGYLGRAKRRFGEWIGGRDEGVVMGAGIIGSGAATMPWGVYQYLVGDKRMGDHPLHEGIDEHTPFPDTKDPGYMAGCYGALSALVGGPLLSVIPAGEGYPAVAGAMLIPPAVVMGAGAAVDLAEGVEQRVRGYLSDALLEDI